MGYRLSKITTRTGDDGSTSVGVGERLLKNHDRIEALGTIDELNSVIGMVLAYKLNGANIVEAFTQVQQDLFDLGSELCPPYREAITQEKIIYLDQCIETWNATLPPLKEFILPGGNIKAATCHLARTVARRAERTLVTLHQTEPVNLNVLQYLNRLSDVLFIAARILARETLSEEPLWDHERKK
jgi:cob(I)alamin adenosyltransferase